jgi:hypothetical protein
LAKTFKGALKGVDKALKNAQSRALNRALSQAQTKLSKQLREETGLKTDTVKSRIRAKKSKVNSLSVVIGIATKFGIAVNKFSNSTRRVLARYKDGSKRARTGVSARIGKTPRSILPGAFQLNGKGNAIVGRKLAYDSDGKYINSTIQGKLTTIRTKIFSDVAKQSQASITTFLRKTFLDRINHEIEFALKNKFKK